MEKICDFEKLMANVEEAQDKLMAVSKDLREMDCDWLHQIGGMILFSDGFPLILAKEGLKAAGEGKCPQEETDVLMFPALLGMAKAQDILADMTGKKPDLLQEAGTCIQSFCEKEVDGTEDVKTLTCLQVLSEAGILISTVREALRGERDADALADVLDAVRMDLVASQVVLRQKAEEGK